MRDYYSSTCYRVTSRAAEQLRPVDHRKLENIMKVSKLHRMKLTFPVVHYFTRKLELASNIPRMIVEHGRRAFKLNVSTEKLE